MGKTSDDGHLRAIQKSEKCREQSWNENMYLMFWVVKLNLGFLEPIVEPINSGTVRLPLTLRRQYIEHLCDETDGFMGGDMHCLL